LVFLSICPIYLPIFYSNNKNNNIKIPNMNTNKVVVLGDTNTGKTSLVVRFVSGHYKSNEVREPTIGAFFVTKRICVQAITCKVLLWDTAGQEQYTKFASTYYNHAAAAIITYDVTQPNTIQRLSYWLDELQRNILTGEQPRRMVICVAACKCDLLSSNNNRSSNRDRDSISASNIDRVREEGMRLAEQYGAFFMETSAKENIGVQALFEQLCARVLQYQVEATSGVGLPIPVSVVNTSSGVASPNAKQQQRKALSKSSTTNHRTTSAPFTTSTAITAPILTREIVGNTSLQGHTAAVSSTHRRMMNDSNNSNNSTLVETDESDSTIPSNNDDAIIETTITQDNHPPRNGIVSRSALTTIDKDDYNGDDHGSSYSASTYDNRNNIGMCEGSLLACGVSSGDKSICVIM
jgi:Ras-related protein Rab-5C